MRADRPHRSPSSPLRARPLLGALALLAVTGAGISLVNHHLAAQSPQPTQSVPSAPAAATSTTVLPRPTLPNVAQQIAVPQMPLVAHPATDGEPEANVFRGVGPGVPEPYTGDPAGQALWEKTVEEDQQTLQPDDLIEEPPVPKLDLRNNPAYEDLHLDADGNTNE